MLSRLIKIELATTEYRRLSEIARRRKRTVESLVKEAVERTYFSPEPASPVDFSKLAAFGIWADEARSDNEILNEFGGDWSDFPLPG